MDNGAHARSSRRDFLRALGLAGAGLTLASLSGSLDAAGTPRREFAVEEVTISDLQAAMQAGRAFEQATRRPPQYLATTP